MMAADDVVKDRIRRLLYVFSVCWNLGEWIDICDIATNNKLRNKMRLQIPLSMSLV